MNHDRHLDTENSTTFLCAIDWMQICCEKSHEPNTGHFVIKKLNYETQQFKAVQQVEYNRELFAIILSENRLNPTNDKYFYIKIENRFLYQSNLIELIKALMYQIGVKFHHFTRLDICLDFQKFNDGYEVNNFMSDFMTGKILKIGGGKFAAHGKCGQNFDYQTLYFGTRGSGCFTRIYNKTEEMKQGKNKHYISERWKKANFDFTKNTYRLEFQISARKTRGASMETGEIRDLELDDLSNIVKIEDLIMRYANHYFNFRLPADYKNVTRMHKIELIDLSNSQWIIIDKNDSTSSNRVDKMVIKYLYTLTEQHRELPSDMQLVVNNVLNPIIKSCKLEEWFEKKIPDFERSHYRD